MPRRITVELLIDGVDPDIYDPGTDDRPDDARERAEWARSYVLSEVLHMLAGPNSLEEAGITFKIRDRGVVSE